MPILDFYAWPLLASRVFARKPNTLDKLSERIHEECLKLDLKDIRRSVLNFIKRLQLVAEEKGGHIENKL